jgi:integrase
LTNGRFVEKRQKTGELIDVPVCEEAIQIIEKYKGKNYLLCVMDNYKDYHDFTSRWDKALKKIGTTEIVPDRVGRRRKVVYHPLFPNITTYTARYTFASIASNDCEIPTETIGKCLAHAWSKNTVTARYISDDRRKVDQAFALVMEKVRG